MRALVPTWWTTKAAMNGSNHCHHPSEASEAAARKNTVISSAIRSDPGNGNRGLAAPTRIAGDCERAPQHCGHERRHDGRDPAGCPAADDVPRADAEGDERADLEPETKVKEPRRDDRRLVGARRFGHRA